MYIFSRAWFGSEVHLIDSPPSHACYMTRLPYERWLDHMLTYYQHTLQLIGHSPTRLLRNSLSGYIIIQSPVVGKVSISNLYSHAGGAVCTAAIALTHTSCLHTSIVPIYLLGMPHMWWSVSELIGTGKPCCCYLIGCFIFVAVRIPRHA